MIISPTLNNNKKYLVKDGRITRLGWDFLKRCDKKDRDKDSKSSNNNYK